MQVARRAAQALLWPTIALAAAGTVLHALWLLGLDHRALRTLVDEWVYNGVVVLAGLACLLRALAVPEGRAPWIAFGVGLLSWAAADIYWTANYENAVHVPAPSWADAGFLATLGCFYVGIALLIRQRIGSWTPDRLFDAAIAGLAAASVATALLAPVLIGLTNGNAGVVFTNLAYPIADLSLVALVVGGIVALEGRGTRPLVLVGVGLLLWAGADTWYLYLDATNSYVGGVIDSLWLIGAVVIALAAATSASAPGRRYDRRAYHASVIPSAVAALLAVGALVWDHFQRWQAVSVWLAAATLVVVTIRFVLTYRENSRLLSALHSEAVTDALTGLGNRRKLSGDLDRLLDPPAAAGVHVFALFDLDGFKGYNDAYGHPVGDALLCRLGSRLAEVVPPGATAYRFGGDEFCFLAPIPDGGSEPLFARVRAALTEDGEGFSITASGGAVLLPDEAGSARAALRLADRRMYTEKSGRIGRDEHARNLLLQIVRDREPALSDHQHDVADLARRVGRALELDAEEVDVVGRAAELHDIGKIAIPDAILSRPGPLTRSERELMETHTLVGERILSTAPAMAPVARLVRSSHERWDGHGYPDGLAEESIPLGSRLIFICDTFHAITTGRPYRAAGTVADAVAELRRCAGTQFDPLLVETFCMAIAPGWEPAPSPAPAASPAPSALGRPASAP